MYLGHKTVGLYNQNTLKFMKAVQNIYELFIRCFGTYQYGTQNNKVNLK